MTSVYRARLGALLSTLRASDGRVHSMFVKCIKPNGAMVPDAPDAAYMLPQLHTQGILHAVSIAQRGFPHRFELTQVHAKFGPLLDQLVAQGAIAPTLAGLPPPAL
eukprot:5021147-Prymnesium_polylepis.1